jgi:chaperone required for assembly of F1-ATPase
MAKIKKFYQAVAIREEGDRFLVTLDGRPVRSPNRRLMTLPSRALAEALANEWQRQGDEIETGSMSVMQLASHAIDVVIEEPDSARAEIVKYARSDLLCYRAGHPADLVARQSELWDPVLDRFRTEHDIGFRLATGINYVEQDAADIEAFARLVAALDGFALAGAHAVTTLTGSALVALALRFGWIAADAAWRICHVDEDYQAELWGIDKEAMQRRQLLLADFAAAVLALATPSDPARAAG